MPENFRLSYWITKKIGYNFFFEPFRYFQAILISKKLILRQEFSSKRRLVKAKEIIKILSPIN